MSLIFLLLKLTVFVSPVVKLLICLEVSAPYESKREFLFEPPSKVLLFEVIFPVLRIAMARKPHNSALVHRSQSFKESITFILKKQKSKRQKNRDSTLFPIHYILRYLG